MKNDFSCQRDKKIILKEKGCTKMVDMAKVLFFTCDGYLTTVFLKEDQQIRVSKLLKLFEIELEEFGFLRANHNTIVNTKHIFSIEGGNKRMLTLTNNFQIKISRRKLFRFK